MADEVRTYVGTTTICGKTVEGYMTGITDLIDWGVRVVTGWTLNENISTTRYRVEPVG